MTKQWAVVAPILSHVAVCRGASYTIHVTNRGAKGRRSCASMASRLRDAAAKHDSGEQAVIELYRCQRFM